MYYWRQQFLVNGRRIYRTSPPTDEVTNDDYDYCPETGNPMIRQPIKGKYFIFTEKWNIEYHIYILYILIYCLIRNKTFSKQ